MSLIDWNDERLSVHVEQFDKEHKHLVHLINELHAAMKAGKGRDIMGKILDELVAYTKSHFSAEEALMSRVGYPAQSSHRAQHANFVERVGAFHGQFTADNTTVTLEVLQFLQGWLVEHIQGADREFGAFVNSRAAVPRNSIEPQIRQSLEPQARVSVEPPSRRSIDPRAATSGRPRS
ncbi:MAG: bacteriohemerythrin [Polyangiaceae bacterium]|jgi:hemerythrin